MAHLHFKRTVYKSGGAAAVGRVAYITRQPVHAVDRVEQQLRYIGNGEREDLVFTTSRNLPAWCHGNPHTFFQAAEQYERKGGVSFEEWKISLPQELGHRQNMDLAHDVVDAIAGDKLPITYAFHDPRTMDEQQQQPHLHLLLSSRQNDGITRTPAQHFQRWNAQHPERGGAQKDEAFRHMGSVKAHRVLIADLVNAHLERAGLAMRVHPDTLTERGMDRKPEPKLLPSESRDYREKGLISERMQQVLDIRVERVQQMAREQNNARAYWESRKAELGLTRDMPMAVKLARLTEARLHRVTHAPERPSLAQLRDQERELAYSIQGLEHHISDLQHARQQEQRGQALGREAWRGELAAERVLAAGVRHGLPRDREAEQAVARLEPRERLEQALRAVRELAQTRGRDEYTGGVGLRVRLHEREREDERGMSW